MSNPRSDSTSAREIPFGRPMIGDEEKQAVMDVLSGPQLVHGPRAKQFERDFAAFLGPTAHATTLGSCTAGLHLAYVRLGIGPGDEIIVPAQTHVATAHTVEITGATPVFVDCEAATGNIDVRQIEAALTPRTRAISVVHYLGLPVDMDEVNALAARRGISVVEDCALAVGSRYKGVPCGLLGDIGLFSFYPVKHLTTAEGGMAVSRYADVVKRIEQIKAFGYDKSIDQRVMPGVYDVIQLGLNYRMNELAAAIGIEQMKKVPRFLAQRRKNAVALRHHLATLHGISVLSDGDAAKTHSDYCIAAVLDDRLAPHRGAIMNSLKERGIGTSVYYPVAVPLTKYYSAKYGHSAAAFPNAHRISTQSIALPVGPHLDESDMARIAEGLKSAIEGVHL